jgi:hypothetical protein
VAHEGPDHTDIAGQCFEKDSVVCTRQQPFYHVAVFKRVKRWVFQAFLIMVWDDLAGITPLPRRHLGHTSRPADMSQGCYPTARWHGRYEDDQQQTV